MLLLQCWYYSYSNVSIIIGRSVGISMASSRQEYFILRNDMPIAKANHFLTNLLAALHADHVTKGELLVKEALQQDGSQQSHDIYTVALNRIKTVSCSNSDVAPLSEDDYEWLAAIGKNMDRWQVYIQGDKLNTVKALQVGDKMWVSITAGDGNPPHLPGTFCCHATVQYIGLLRDTPGRWIGVELKVRQNVHYNSKCTQKYIKDRVCNCVSVYSVFSIDSNFSFVICHLHQNISVGILILH